MAESIKLQNYKKKTRNFNDNTNRILHKRQPIKPELGDHIIYINNNTNCKALIAKHIELNRNAKELIIYALGAAIPKAIIFALRFCEEFSDCYECDTKTTTTELKDDLEVLWDETEDDDTIDNLTNTVKRRNSSIRIRLVKKSD